MALSVARGIGWLRIAIGVALVAAPGPLLRATAGGAGTAGGAVTAGGAGTAGGTVTAGGAGTAGGDSSGSMLLLARTVGIRDVVIGAGTLAALRSGDTEDVRRWVTVGLASDALDALAGVAGVKLVGRPGAAIATGSALPVLAAGLWARHSLGQHSLGQQSLGPHSCSQHSCGPHSLGSEAAAAAPL